MPHYQNITTGGLQHYLKISFFLPKKPV